MTQNKNLIIAAAVAGLITGASVRSFANEPAKEAAPKAEKNSCKGKMEDCKKEDGKGSCCGKMDKKHMKMKKDGKGSCGKAGCDGKMDKKADAAKEAPKAEAPKTEEHK